MIHSLSSPAEVSPANERDAEIATVSRRASHTLAQLIHDVQSLAIPEAQGDALLAHLRAAMADVRAAYHLASGTPASEVATARAADAA